jgi:hypothetical protein
MKASLGAICSWILGREMRVKFRGLFSSGPCLSAETTFKSTRWDEIESHILFCLIEGINTICHLVPTAHI